MRQQRNILREIAKDNRGSGIVMVLVCMLCVALMGAAMLSMSYTGLRIKVAQRQAEKDFYSAETAVDEIRAGLQGLVSEAIGEAYKEVLINYNDGLNVVTRFQEKFRNNLAASSVLTASTYDVASLHAFVSNPSAVAVSGTGTLAWNDVKKTLTLKGVKVSYTAANNYVTDIETDLVISMPDFAYVMSTYSISGLPEHALIARDALVQNTGSSVITIDGSAYAGMIALSGEGSQMILKEGTMVCAGNADISNAGGSDNSARFQVDDSARLWAGRIVVNNGSSVDLGGETCVLDDLDLSGAQARAVLRGSYYGFGNGTPDSGSGIKAEYSSAILVNGRDSTLDMSGLNRLMLAGRSFISNTFFPNVMGSSNVETLESVSVRSNQQMYLVPVEYLDGASGNPHIHDSGAPTLALTPEGTEKLEEYHAELRPLTTALPGAGGQQVTYYFMDFQDKDSANQYFEDYFASHSSGANSYLTNSSNLNAKNSGAAGYTLRGKDGSYTVSHSGGIAFDCTSMRSTFYQLKKTLIDSNTSAAESNPYDYIVDTDKVSGVAGTREFLTTDDSGTKVVGLVVDSDYTVDGSTDSSVRLIIASGNVTVTKHYKGLIISGGKITITGSNVNVEADEDGVVAAFEGIAGGDPNDKLGTYLLHGGTQAGGDGGAGGSAAGWNLDKLVTYRNWTKNG